MRIFGFEISKAKMVQKATNTTQPLLTAVEQVWASLARPGMDRLEQMGGNGIRIPYYPIPPRTIFDLANYSDTLKTIHIALNRETFRNGIIVEKIYAAKCQYCGEEYDEVPKENICMHKDETGTICGGRCVEPPEKMKSEFEKWMACVNENGQKLTEVLMNLHSDVHTIDDAFQLILKDYAFDAQGNMTGAKIKEILRGDPIIMRIIADRQGRPGRNDKGEKVYTCTEHRDQIFTNKSHCPACGKQLFQAFFKADMETSGAMGQEGKTGVYYIDGEVKHKSFYHPSLTYGFSPVVSCWQKVVTLMYQERYIKEYYGKERPPRGLLFVNTSNNESLQKAWRAHKDISRQNPHDIYPIGVEFTKESGSKLVEWIEFTKPLVDMQYTENRNEYKRTIGAIFGVQPIFQNDIQQSGGLNNEGLQISVTNRTADATQGWVNDYLEEISKQFGLYEAGWISKLAPVEIKDEMSNQTLKGKKIENAIAMKGLGYKAEVSDKEMNFDFEKDTSLPAENPASPPTPDLGKLPAGNESVETSGTPMKSDDKKKRLIDLYRDELETVMKADDGFVGKASPNEEKLHDLEKAAFHKSFEGISEETSEKIKEYLIDASVKRISYSEMINHIMELSGIDEVSADRIVRTELHEMRNKLRELAYSEKEPEETKYKWVGPTDKRTTEICKNITERSAKGVSMDELKKIVEEEGTRGGFKPRDWSPHINCRHTFVRHFS